MGTIHSHTCCAVVAVAAVCKGCVISCVAYGSALNRILLAYCLLMIPNRVSLFSGLEAFDYDAVAVVVTNDGTSAGSAFNSMRIARILVAGGYCKDSSLGSPLLGEGETVTNAFDFTSAYNHEAVRGSAVIGRSYCYSRLS